MNAYEKALANALMVKLAADEDVKDILTSAAIGAGIGGAGLGTLSALSTKIKNPKQAKQFLRTLSKMVTPRMPKRKKRRKKKTSLKKRLAMKTIKKSLSKKTKAARKAVRKALKTLGIAPKSRRTLAARIVKQLKKGKKGVKGLGPLLGALALTAGTGAAIGGGIGAGASALKKLVSEE